MFGQSSFTYSSHGTPKPIYLPPRDLPKYSPLQNSMQQLPIDSKSNQGKERQRKQVQRAFSVPNRPSRQQRQPIKRQASNEELPTQCPDQAPSLEITLPSNSMKPNNGPARVFWEIKDGNEPHQITGQDQEDTSILDRHAQELAELRLGVEQVTERELEMAKRLEDFIVLSQDQNTQLQAEVQDLRNLLAIREEQLASATFRLGVIEEEREEDERKLNVAVAAVERMNVLEEQFAGLLKDVHQLYAVNADGIRKTYINT